MPPEVLRLQGTPKGPSPRAFGCKTPTLKALNSCLFGTNNAQVHRQLSGSRKVSGLSKVLQEQEKFGVPPDVLSVFFAISPPSATAS